MNFKTIRGLAFGVLAFAGSVAASVSAQDLIARQAPIDRRLKSVDSVALQRLVPTEEIEIHEDLYTSWNTESAHCYSQAMLPDSFKIDLRGFHMPTPSRNVTSKFGYRPAFRRMHKGLDIKVYTGDTISAAFDGKVRVVKYDAGGYGKYVVIRHNNGLETIYGHMSKQLVAVNDEVKAGDPIGLGGNTGRSYGAHLHFETRLLGEAIDPALLFDFPNQDVTGDFYVYHSGNNASAKSNSTLLANADKIQEEVKGGSTRSVKASSSKSTSHGHYYKVKKGDSLYAIAGRLGLTVAQLCNMNRINKKTKLRPGQILRY